MTSAAFVPLLLLALTGCAALPAYGPARAPDETRADAFAVAFLDTIQAQSFRERRELCGFFVLQPDGQITATPPRGGSFASCEMDAPRAGSGIFATYHTHGAYGPDYDNEVPSDLDLLSDWEFGLNGYVATPGGRVWRVDFSDRNTVQVCGRGCILVDPGFVPEDEANIRPGYSLPDLHARADSF